jgi:hypothetical protein
LKRKDNNKATILLISLANHVGVIMKKRGWKVGKLCEMLPGNPNLLGLNINRGREIRIRLRLMDIFLMTGRIMMSIPFFLFMIS